MNVFAENFNGMIYNRLILLRILFSRLLRAFLFTNVTHCRNLSTRSPTSAQHSYFMVSLYTHANVAPLLVPHVNPSCDAKCIRLTNRWSIWPYCRVCHPYIYIQLPFVISPYVRNSSGGNIDSRAFYT